VVSWLIAQGLKLLFKIPRPCAGLSFCEMGYSFPSGHAAVIFAAMTVAIVYSKSRKMDFSFLALALLVSLSRVFLGLHRIQDIAVGGLIGLGVGFLVYKNYRKILQKIKLRQ
jgi:membrane-associated phospholipid phosphatase